MTQHYFLVVLHDLELGEPGSLLAGTADISSALRSMNLFCICKPIDEERVFLLVPEATRFPPSSPEVAFTMIVSVLQATESQRRCCLSPFHLL